MHALEGSFGLWFEFRCQNSVQFRPLHKRQTARLLKGSQRLLSFPPLKVQAVKSECPEAFQESPCTGRGFRSLRGKR